VLDEIGHLFKRIMLCIRRSVNGTGLRMFFGLVSDPTVVVKYSRKIEMKKKGVK
jgi:hypothetical protein